MKLRILFWILTLPLIGSPSFGESDPFCRDHLKPELRELKGFQADSLARRIESGSLSLKPVSGQSVFKVIGLPRGKSFMVRFQDAKYPKDDFGVKSHGIDLRTRIKREEATCRLDRLLGFSLVPETRLTRISGNDASIQVRVEGSEFNGAQQYQNHLNRSIRTLPIAVLRHKTELERMAILDIVSGNMDRNITNFIYDDLHNRIWAIDHADSFPVVEKAPHIHWFWTFWSDDLKRPLEANSRKKIIELNAKELAKKMRTWNLLEEQALLQMIRRVELLQADIIAHPGTSMAETGERIQKQIIQFVSLEGSP